jgi:hypothetical protein
MSAEWFERNAKFAESEGFGELAERLREKKRNWHTWVTQYWDEVGWSHHGSVEDTANALAAIYAEERNKPLSQWRERRHVLRKLTLDLMCAHFPEGHPPPAALVRLMKYALELPESHEVGSWPVTAGRHDDRGDPDHEMRTLAKRIDQRYLGEYGNFMGLRTLARLVEKQLHRKPDRTRLRQWRLEAGLKTPQNGGK